MPQIKAVVGNPPYQKIKEGNKKSKAIWPKFVKCTFDVVDNNGIVAFIHPGSWRLGLVTMKPIYDILLSNNLIYLNMNGFSQGIKTFGATTSYDWYICQKCKYNGKTIISDEDDDINMLDISGINIIPNGKFNEIISLFTKDETDKIRFIKDCIYHTQNDHVSKDKTKEFKYPVVYSLPQSGIKLRYSNTNKNGHFGISKLIGYNGTGCQLLLDIDGQYGMTEWSWAIADEPENLKLIKKAMESEKFLELCKYMRKMNGDKYNHLFIKQFRKDFYKEFI